MCRNIIKPIFNNLLLGDINQLIFPMNVPSKISYILRYPSTIDFITE